MTLCDRALAITASNKKTYLLKDKIWRQIRRGVVPRKCAWSEEDMKKAIDVMESNQMGICEAAKLFNVDRTSLRRRLERRAQKNLNCGAGMTELYLNIFKSIDINKVSRPLIPFHTYPIKLLRCM